jgi:hypothetical protein
MLARLMISEMKARLFQGKWTDDGDIKLDFDWKSSLAAKIRSVS